MARWALLAYVAVIVYASLHPFQSWRNPGIDPWEFVLAPWPRYWTGFDLVTNWLAYVPLGALMVWTFYPRYRPWWAVILAFLGGAMLSASLEGLQTYLPNRISSNVDLGCNALGALCGVNGVCAGSSIRPVPDWYWWRPGSPPSYTPRHWRLAPARCCRRCSM
jgi:VanZ family protein